MAPNYTVLRVKQVAEL